MANYGQLTNKGHGGEYTGYRHKIPSSWNHVFVCSGNRVVRGKQKKIMNERNDSFEYIAFRWMLQILFI